MANGDLANSELGQRRKAAAAELTRLMLFSPAFSYLRLSDGETQWLRAVQKGEDAPWYRYAQDKANMGMAVGTRGLELRHYDRFLKSLEQCSYLDYCENFSEANRRFQAEITFDRDPGLARNPSQETGYIIFDWAFHEMGQYLRDRRVLFASAEAALLRELYADPTYRNAAQRYFPADAHVAFHQIREDGRNYSENLDLIKDDLTTVIRTEKIDTLFLSLATGAKIVCFELAQELKIKAIDWGAMSRGLTYCGSPGYHAVRTDHVPFFLRVPFDTYMAALERACPAMPRPVVMFKAQCQLILDLQAKELMRTRPVDVNGGELDLSASNLRLFHKGLKEYRSLYSELVRNDAEAVRLDREFRQWRLRNGIGLAGRLFRLLVRIKGLGRSFRRKLAGAAASKQ